MQITLTPSPKRKRVRKQNSYESPLTFYNTKIHEPLNKQLDIHRYQIHVLVVISEKETKSMFVSVKIPNLIGVLFTSARAIAKSNKKTVLSINLNKKLTGYKLATIDQLSAALTKHEQEKSFLF